ncbi:hypothetical protein HDV06_001688 [Boothiomyces sp. JEL0866]|nr:hypothetical protein HDV06_001688 [Boothiomyces sp. JEL0866]
MKCPQYEYVFINAPVSKEEPNSYFWFKQGYQVTIDAIKQIWSEEFVGIIAMSWGGVAAALITPHLAPQPKWLMTFVTSFPEDAKDFFAADLARLTLRETFLA